MPYRKALNQGHVDAHTVHDLWQQHHTNPSADTTNRLVVQYAPLVKYVAGRVQSRVPSHVEYDEITQAGLIGLHDAITKYDPAANNEFETYAVHRIKGEILDELRALDPVSRKDRTDIKTLEAASHDLEHALGRPPTTHELATHLNLPAGEVRDITAVASRTRATPIDELLSEAALTDRTSPSAHDTFDTHASVGSLHASIRKLPRRDQQIVALYYFEQFTFTQIARVYRITESRVSQIHTRITRNLAKLIAETT